MITKIAKLLEKLTDFQDVKVTIPENTAFGHYTTNVALILSKKLSISSRESAENIRKAVLEASGEVFEKIEIAGPGFLNFYLSKETLTNEINGILEKKDSYGENDIGKGKTIVVDYSAPNIAKPMSIGHLRSTVIGDALVRILRTQGYKVVGDNHLGDWGTQFGKLIYAWKNWRDDDEFKKNPIKHLVELYIRFHKEAEENEALEDIAREETAKLQKGDKDNTDLWRMMVDESRQEFNKTYERLGVKFDTNLGESFYEPMLNDIVRLALQKGIAREEDGAIKIFFEGGERELPPSVLQKKDGSHLYMTTDLATIKYRIDTYNPEKVLYVVANEQALHFEQVFEAAKRLGLITEEREFVHIKFGMMLGESGKKFSTRKGEFITLDELIEKAVSEAKTINEDSAEKVGIGAVKYYDLSHHRMSDIAFNWDAVLDMRGNSSPYLQYTYARFANILNKAGEPNGGISLEPLKDESEKKVIDLLVHYPDELMYAAQKYEPNHLTDYLFRLANAANSFYENCQIMNAEDDIRNERLKLAKMIMTVIKNGLNVLGIEVMERM